MAVWIHNHETNESRLIEPKVLAHWVGAGWTTNPNPPEDETEPKPDDELKELKAKAKELKIKGYGNMNPDTLKAKILLAEGGK